MLYKLNVRALIDAYGGVQGLRRSLAVQHGFDAVPETATVHKWIAREQVPSAWLLLLCVHAHEHAPGLHPAKFATPMTAAESEAEAAALL